MKKLLGALFLMLSCSAGAFAAGDVAHLDKAPNRINDLAALQNGAKLFVNYCLNCHSATSMRYNRLRDIGLTDEQIRDNLILGDGKVGDLMTVNMTLQEGREWFGAAPPDLSVIARAKSINAGPTGSDYLYTYLRTFYRDATKPTGWDNIVFPNVGMPHALWELQGDRTMTQVEMAHGAEGWERITTQFDETGVSTVKREPVADYRGKGLIETTFTPANSERAAAYDSDVADLVAFMTWMAEPVKQQRMRLGVWVLLFLGIFLFVTWRLNAVYWKDIK